MVIAIVTIESTGNYVMHAVVAVATYRAIQNLNGFLKCHFIREIVIMAMNT